MANDEGTAKWLATPEVLAALDEFIGATRHDYETALAVRRLLSVENLPAGVVIDAMVPLGDMVTATPLRQFVAEIQRAMLRTPEVAQ